MSAQGSHSSASPATSAPVVIAEIPSVGSRHWRGGLDDGTELRITAWLRFDGREVLDIVVRLSGDREWSAPIELLEEP